MRIEVLTLLVVACGGSGLSVPPSDPEDTSVPTVETDLPDTVPDSDPPGDSGTSPSPWRHTVTVDGDPSDFTADEAFPTSGGTTWITWDDTHVYLAVQHPDVSTGGPEHWVLAYLGDGATGTTTGVLFNTQQPSLPAPFAHLLRWKADGSFASWMSWDGAVWQDATLDDAGVTWAEGADTVELAVPLAAIGATDAIAAHVGWIYEGAGFESSYAPVPATSFVDGYDPDYTAWYGFDLTAPDAPASTAPSP